MDASNAAWRVWKTSETSFCTFGNGRNEFTNVHFLPWSTSRRILPRKLNVVKID
jgi:hypothetical protein